MNTHQHSSPVSAKDPSQPTATLPSTPTPPRPAAFASTDVEQPRIPRRLIESEARTAWYHFQAAVGLLAAEFERSMSKVYRSVVEKLNRKPSHR